MSEHETMNYDEKEDMKDMNSHSDDIDVESLAPWSSKVDRSHSQDEHSRHEAQNIDEEKGQYQPNILTRTLSRKSAASTKDPGPPPDGGVVAWTQVAMAHLTVFSTWGWITSYGVFQSYYTETLQLQPSAISWLGSVQIFLLFFLGTFTGRAVDAGLFRVVYIAGMVLQLLGIFSASFATQYWQLFLSQGLCMGLANGLQFCPATSLISTYFVKNRPLALGFAALGSCTGGVIFPVVVQQLLPRIGFAWTLRVCGFIMLFTGVVSAIFYRTRLPPRKSGPLIEWSAFKELPYLFFVSGMFFNFWGLYFAFFYVGAFGRNILGLTYAQSIDLLLTMVGIGFIFRLVGNWWSVYIGALNMITPFALLCGVMMFAWIGIRSESTLYVFAALYGSGSAGMQSMFPPALASLTDDLSKMGARMGAGFSVVSFACLTGAPLAGALIQRNNGDYLYAQIWGGMSFVVGTSLLIAARTSKIGWHLRCKI